MTAASSTADTSDTELKRTITGRLLFFYVLGDVLGSGIYVLIGAVAAAVGGAFWLAFAAGVTVATITGMAYAELVTKYPQAAGASLYVHRAFRKPMLTFLVTICMLSASFAAAGSLATGFARYFSQVVPLPPPLLIALLFVVLLCLVNFIGITESVVANLVMTLVEVAGLALVLVIGIVHVARGDASWGVLTDFTAEGNPVFALVAGVALAFFAMTGFENAANVAEETVRPAVTFPRALIGGMVAAGGIYVLVAMSAALVVPIDVLGGSEAALLETVRAGILPLPVGMMIILFAIIAMVAITNTTLVAVVTESRILYGMAREGVVPRIFSRLHLVRRSPWVGLLFSGVVVATLLVVGQVVLSINPELDLVDRLATVTVVFLLFIYGLVIVSALKLRGHDETGEAYRANTVLLYLGLLANAVLLVYVVVDDPSSLLWVAGLLALGLALYLVARLTSTRRRDPLDVHEADQEV
ncbi:amino acid permease [Auraticoccus sp. F435]|uniref:Amino acid permease n=1 Tax=Auraticoccus cholistanensis TaxID=2656650 RepID=A0A6A9USL4_9ACTN|nr:APC family permease [Auraticoccus cholistanensis]MVA75916.1 amino acid permease [Auraticoccus cholistanensis]